MRKEINSIYNELFIAILDRLNRELERVYFNKYQKKYISPFSNTGEYYENKTFKVQAYNWYYSSDDVGEGLEEPNFSYKSIQMFWYKHSHRGLVVYTTDEDFVLSLDFLINMLNDCLLSIQLDFDDMISFCPICKQDWSKLDRNSVKQAYICPKCNKKLIEI